VTDLTPPSPAQNNKVLFAVIVSLAIGAVAGVFMQKYDVFAKPGEAGGVDESKVESIVKRVIDENPDLIMASLQNMQKKMYEKEMKKSAEGLKTYKEEIYNSKTSPVAGDKNAKVVLVEFFDYHCGYCKKVAPALKQALDENKDIKVIFKELPILSPDSRKAAQAALAVYKLKPEVYFGYHQLLMEHRGAYTDEKLAEMAEKLGVNEKSLKTEMNASWVEQELEATKDLAAKLGVQGTPGIIIGNELIPGAIDYEAMKFRIKAAEDLAE
jgi:protein-disulfide isomerase